MIQLDDCGISPEAQQHLTKTQADINAQATYKAQVALAEAHWLNRTRNAAFTEIRQQLSVMCREIGRCGYCEDSEGYQIEHIAPKHHYPDQAFVWVNYLLACGKCNSPKKDYYAVFRAVDGLVVHQDKFNGRPPAGDPLLLNPRTENPMEHLWLDLNTFAFAEYDLNEYSESYQRADYTIDILSLNRRDKLVKARQIAYKHFFAQLRHYVQDKQAGTFSAEHLAEFQETIQESPHPTVWREMQRQHTLPSPDDPQAFAYPELHALFTTAPEALNW